MVSGSPDQITVLHELEAWGYGSLGAIGGGKAAGELRKRLPIFGHELEAADAACAKNGARSWAYWWKCLDSYREAQSSTAPKGGPKQDIPDGHYRDEHGVLRKIFSYA